MQEDADFDALLGLAYEAAFDRSAWHPALTAIARSAGSELFHLACWNAAESRDELGVIPGAAWAGALQQYNTHYITIDPRQGAIAALGGRDVMVCSEHFDERFVGRSEIYQDFLLPNGLRYAAGLPLGQLGERTVSLALLRPQDAGAWGGEQVRFLRRLLPHLQRAAALMLRDGLREEDHGVESVAAELTHLALITLSASGRVLAANARAESLLRRGTLLATTHGRLEGADARASSALAKAIETVARSGAPQHLRLRAHAHAHAQTHADADGADAVLTLMRAPARHAGDGASLRLWCVVAEGQPRVASVRQLMAWFALTPAQARVVRALAHGSDIGRFAQEAGVAPSTVRTHVDHAMAKLGVNDQRALVRRVLALPAVRD